MSPPWANSLLVLKWEPAHDKVPGQARGSPIAQGGRGSTGPIALRYQPPTLPHAIPVSSGHSHWTDHCWPFTWPAAALPSTVPTLLCGFRSILWLVPSQQMSILSSVTRKISFSTEGKRSKLEFCVTYRREDKGEGTGLYMRTIYVMQGAGLLVIIFKVS